MTNPSGATMDIGQFRSSLDDWLEDNRSALAPAYEGSGTLDEQMAQLAKVKGLTYEAGWMRRGWPDAAGWGEAEAEREALVAEEAREAFINKPFQHRSVIA